MKLGDMMSDEFELKVINKPIYYIEIVALLNRLINDRSYESIRLNGYQNEFLDLLKGLRIKGLELFELYLYNESIDDIDMLEKILNEINQIDFLYLLFGEELSKEEVKSLIKGFHSIDEMPQVNKYLSSYSDDSIRLVFERTEEFIDKLVDIFKALNEEVVEQLSKQDKYKEGILKVSSDLKSKIPLDVAQGIMGKKFKRVFNFNTYYFVPSYFYMNRPMRTFNEKIQILIYPVQEVNAYNKNTLANALRIIGDNTRLEIIKKLAIKPMYGKELAKELGLVTSTVSHHLEQLRSIGIINEEREKSVKFFSININEYNKLCDAMKNFIEG
jgi:DNA-binding transcriptional ArsR family regulator